MTNPKEAVLPVDLKRQNYEQVLYALGGRKIFTIAELAAATRISRQTVTKAVEHFLAQQVIMAQGKGSSTMVGGKKPEVYGLNTCRYIICLATYGGTSSFSLMSFAYEKIDEIEASFFLPEIELPGFLADVAEKCKVLLERNGIRREDFYGLIFCASGIINSHEGIIRFSSSFPEWGRNIHIQQLLSEALGADVYVCVENIAKVCTSTMLFHQEVQGKRVAVFYFDYGVGVTFLDDGKIAVSKNNVSCELGHMMLDPSDQEVCGCGARGCFEVLIGKKRIQKWIEQLPDADRHRLMEGFGPQDDIRIFVMRRDEQGEPCAAPIVEYMANIFGYALRNVILGFDPDHMIIQGPMSGCSARFLSLVEKKVRENNYLAEDFELDIRCSTHSVKELQEEGGVNIILKSFLNTL